MKAYFDQNLLSEFDDRSNVMDSIDHIFNTPETFNAIIGALMHQPGQRHEFQFIDDAGLVKGISIYVKSDIGEERTRVILGLDIFIKDHQSFKRKIGTVSIDLKKFIGTCTSSKFSIYREFMSRYGMFASTLNVLASYKNWNLVSAIEGQE